MHALLIIYAYDNIVYIFLYAIRISILFIYVCMQLKKQLQIQ